jgi:sortase A
MIFICYFAFLSRTRNYDPLLAIAMDQLTNQNPKYPLLQHVSKARLLLLAEYSGYTIGIALLLYTLLTWVAGRMDNKVAVARFLNTASSVQQVDVSDWSVKRIDVWQATLTDQGPEAFGILSIDSVDISVPVFVGTSERNLNAGAGWIEGTDEPGLDYGNSGFAGHRDGFFRGLQHVRKGQLIRLQTGEQEFVYEIEEISIVEPHDTEVLLPRESEVITLVTCFPFYFVGNAPQRYIVTAVRKHNPH